ncbi:ExbD/TolR family protein [Roseibium algae]|uniref:Biopolymer transporter ExbD n=1 Tax=Roseibium algae TaxID=3123038 RepID=A0ABU8TKM2_9HYPH
MKKLQLTPIQRKSENTISLINIVFLMLIFFLIAGQLAPPMDSEVDLIDSTETDPVPPPDALVAREDGSLHYRGNPITVEAYLANAPGSDASETSGETSQGSTPSNIPVRLVADKDMAAKTLVDIVGQLQSAGAGKVTVVTMRSQ